MNKPAIWPHFVCGFSLIELITTLSIASILLALGIPSFQTLIQNNRMTATINTIVSHLNMARSEAIKRGVRVVLCPSADGVGCKNTIIWDENIIMFTDNNKSGAFEPKDKLLRHINISSDPILIHSTVGRRKAAYDANGFSMGMNVTITFCDTTEKIDPKAIIVSNSGRPRISDTKYGGDPLDCNLN